jgi:protein ImuB
MKRVAALWLPNWSIDRILRAEPTLAPPERGRSIAAPDLSGLAAAAQAEQVLQCDAPRNTGWRPGARWARTDAAAQKGQSRRDVEMQIAALPAHQRPPMRMLGRSSEAADHPFRAMPPDEVARPMREMARRTEAAPHPFRPLAGDDGGRGGLRPAVPSVRYPGDGPHPDKPLRRGSNDPHAAPPGVAAFFDTGRTMAGLVGQVCGPATAPGAPGGGDGIVLITTQKVGARVEVAAASPGAQALGIAPGMALTQVRASVPDVMVRDADPAGDARALAGLADRLARRWTPTVAVSDPDGLFLDLSGVAHLHGGEARMAARLVRLLARAGFTARIGIADTTGAAWAFARFSAAPIALCPAGDHAAQLAPLPAAALRFPEPTLALLRRLGVTSVGDILAQPRAPFARRFGSTAVRCLDQALGQAGEALDPVVPVETVQVVQRFAEPIGSAEAIDHWLGVLVPRLTQALAQAGEGARVLLLVADRVDGRPQPIRIGFARPNRDPAHILRLIRRRIEEIDPGFGIDALRLLVCRTEPLAPQPFDQSLSDQARDLDGLIDLLANRSVPTWRERPEESDVPERSVVRCAPLDEPAADRRRARREDVAQLDTRATQHPWHPRWPRPVRLLRHPERLDHVMAELPDRPPVRFTWRGRRHVVARADGPERITGEWWRRKAERHAVRDYFLVEDEAGQRFWIFRRGDGERTATGDTSWYLHGRFG